MSASRGQGRAAGWYDPAVWISWQMHHHVALLRRLQDCGPNGAEGQSQIFRILFINPEGILFQKQNTKWVKGKNLQLACVLFWRGRSESYFTLKMNRNWFFSSSAPPCGQNDVLLWAAQLNFYPLKLESISFRVLCVLCFSGRIWTSYFGDKL